MLDNNCPRKLGSVDQVPAPQTCRFKSQAVEPFEPVVAHPLRSSLEAPATHVECSAHPKHYRHAHSVSVLVHPFFLLACAEAHPENVGSSVCYKRFHFQFFFLRERTKRRTVRSRDLNPVAFL